MAFRARLQTAVAFVYYLVFRHHELLLKIQVPVRFHRDRTTLQGQQMAWFELENFLPHGLRSRDVAVRQEIMQHLEIESGGYVLDRQQRPDLRGKKKPM